MLRLYLIICPAFYLYEKRAGSPAPSETAPGQDQAGEAHTREVQALLNKKQKEGLSGQSVQIIHATSRAALNEGLRMGSVARNAAQLVRPPRGAQKQVTPLAPEEARTFLETAAGDRLEALFILALSSGLRKGEILGLRWQDLDLEHATLSVHHALNRLDGEYALAEPKTKQSRRTIMIPKIAVTALKAHRARQAAERLAAGPEWNEWGGLVFTTDKGQPLNGSVLSHRFKQILKDAGLRIMRFHDLRHTCATLLLAQGLDPKLVQEFLGHSEIGTTLNVYSHVLPEQRGETAARMDALLGAG